jgi:hypothetical protein
MQEKMLAGFLFQKVETNQSITQIYTYWSIGSLQGVRIMHFSDESGEQVLNQNLLSIIFARD